MQKLEKKKYREKE